MRERAHGLEEKMGKLKITHVDDIAKIIEKQAVQSEIENGRRVTAEKRVIDLEAEVKKVRSDLNKKLRTRDEEIVAAKKKNEDMVNEKERVNNSMRDLINCLKQEIEMKDMEIQSFRYYCQLWEEKDPKVIFDPEHPER